MSGPRREDTRRAIEAMRQLRRASELSVDAETAGPHQAIQPGHKTPSMQHDLADPIGVVEAGTVVRAEGSDRYSDP
jgi:hypothetical protein